MNILELYERLSYGEFINLSISSEGNGTIVEQRRPTIIQHANEALLRLHSKFLLKEKDIIIEQVDHITQYHIDKRFTESSGDIDAEKYLYIKDNLNEPYVGDAIKIISVFNEYGREVPLNDENDKFSYYTPKPLVLQVPAPITGKAVCVTYQARHPELKVDQEDQEIDLPDVLVPAMTAYIAHKVFSNMVGQENIAKGQEQFEVYNSICEEVIDQDLVSTSITSSNTKFHRRGFV